MYACIYLEKLTLGIVMTQCLTFTAVVCKCHYMNENKSHYKRHINGNGATNIAFAVLVLGASIEISFKVN